MCRPLRVEGSERLGRLGTPVILVANHNSHFDTPILLGAMPVGLRRRVAVAAAQDYFYSNPLKGGLVSLLLNTFPLKRNGNGRCSLRQCEDLVRAGWSLLIYPEGTRSVDGGIQAFHKGVGVLAARTGSPVVPLYVGGAHELLPKGTCRPRRTEVVVRAGRMRTYRPDADAGYIARDLRAQVAALAEDAESTAENPVASASEGRDIGPGAPGPTSGLRQPTHAETARSAGATA